MWIGNEYDSRVSESVIMYSQLSSTELYFKKKRILVKREFAKMTQKCFNW